MTSVSNVFMPWQRKWTGDTQNRIPAVRQYPCLSSLQHKQSRELTTPPFAKVSNIFPFTFLKMSPEWPELSSKLTERQKRCGSGQGSRPLSNESERAELKGRCADRARWHQQQEPLGHRTKGDVPLRTLLFPLKAQAEKQLLKYLLCSKCVWLWLVYPRGVQSFQVQISTFLNTAKPLSNVSTEGLRIYKWTFRWLQDLLSEGETNMKPPQQNSDGHSAASCTWWILRKDAGPRAFFLDVGRKEIWEEEVRQEPRLKQRHKNESVMCCRFVLPQWADVAHTCLIRKHLCVVTPYL